MGPKEWSDVVMSAVERAGIPFAIILILFFIIYKIGMPIVTSMAATTQLLNNMNEKLSDIMAHISKEDRQ